MKLCSKDRLLMTIQSKKQVQVPIILEELQEGSYHIFVKCTVGKKVCRFLIDTGASKTVLDIQFFSSQYSKEKILTSEQNTSSLHASVAESHSAALPSLKMGTLIVKDFLVALLSLDHVNSTYDSVGKKPIQGIIGSDILLQYHAKIDYKTMILTLRP